MALEVELPDASEHLFADVTYSARQVQPMVTAVDVLEPLVKLVCQLRVYV